MSHGPVLSATTVDCQDGITEQHCTQASPPDLLPSLNTATLTLVDVVITDREQLLVSGFVCGEAWVLMVVGSGAELKPQTCLPGEDNPFASVCTPAKGFTPSEGQSLVEYESSQVVWLTEPKEAALPTNPRVRLLNFRQINDTLATFQVSTTASAQTARLLHHINFLQ